MDPATISLIIALLPLVEKLVIGGVELFVRKDMTREELIAALEASKQDFPVMTPKEG